MNKENIKKVIEIMEVLEADVGRESVTENQLRQRFGEAYTLYGSYCLGGEKPYVNRMGKDVHKLSQDGIRELHKLRQELRQIEVLEQQTLFNKLLAYFTAFLAVGVVFNYTVGKNLSLEAALISTTSIVFVASLVYVLSKGIVKIL